MPYGRGRLRDVGRTARLLAPKIVRWHADDQQPSRVVPRPELLQSGILRCVATKGSGVDHEDRLADMFGELDVRALKSRKGKGVGGDAGHRGRLREGRGRECSSE